MNSPEYYKMKISSNKYKEQIISYRNEISNILNYKSNKLIIIVGPCSIHNQQEFIDYTIKLKNIKEKYEDKLFFLIRGYSEKSRSTELWKG